MKFCELQCLKKCGVAATPKNIIYRHDAVEKDKTNTPTFFCDLSCQPGRQTTLSLI